MTAADTTSTTKVSAPSYQTKPRRRGLSDKAIVKLFIWPTLILLIAWNVFPLFYSLYLSFTNYSAIVPKAPVWVGFRELQGHPDRPAALEVLCDHRTLCVGLRWN